MPFRASQFLRPKLLRRSVDCALALRIASRIGQGIPTKSNETALSSCGG